MARFLDAVVTGSAPGSMPQAFAMTEAETFFMPDHPGRGIGLGWFCGMLRPSAGTPRMAEARDSARRSRSCLHDGRACSLRPTRKALTFSPSSRGCSVWWGRAEREPGWPTSRKRQRGEGASGGLAMTYLIRHGEKLGNPADERPGGPCVSEMGSARTVALRSLVQDGGRWRQTILDKPQGRPLSKTAADYVATQAPPGGRDRARGFAFHAKPGQRVARAALVPACVPPGRCGAYCRSGASRLSLSPKGS